MCTEHNHNVSNMDADTKAMLERRRVVQALAAGGVLTVTAPSLSGCATNPETGAKQFLAIGDSQLSQMAASSWAEAKQKTPTSSDPRYTKRLRDVGARIARGANKSNEAWDYAVFDTDSKNAFVLPGNRVGFYKGMMDFTDNDDQIAAIMGHVTGKHAAERVSQQMIGQAAIAGGTILAGSQLSKKCKTTSRTQQEYNNCMRGAQQKQRMINGALGMGFTLGILLPYSRKHELQSDLLGAKYMHKAGYDAYQSVKLWEKMAEANSSRQPEFMSTHPDPSRRARELHNYIKYQETLGSQGWESIKMPKKS
jgi:predicted Zn-dependent protease